MNMRNLCCNFLGLTRARGLSNQQTFSIFFTSQLFTLPCYAKIFETQKSGKSDAGLWVRIHFLRIRIRTQSLTLEANTDPDPDPIRIQGFNDQKLEKNYSSNFFSIFFWSKTSIYLSLGLHKVHPSDRRSLQLSKEAIQHFKTCTLKKNSTFVRHFCPPGSGYGSTDLSESGSDRIRNTIYLQV